MTIRSRKGGQVVRRGPQQAVGRRMRASGYSRYWPNDWLRSGGSPLEDINANLQELRVMSRDLFMGGSGLATGAIKTLRTNVVGPGLMLHATPDARMLGITPEQASEWAYQTERRFSLWAGSTDCDIARQNTFVELQQLAMLAWPMSGDCFALLPILPRPHSRYDLRIKLIEADRVCNPSSLAFTGINQQVSRLDNGNMITQGVEVTPYGEVVAYHVCNRHPMTSQYVTQQAAAWERVEMRGATTGRRNILHLFTPERPEQYRGVPVLAPIIAALKQLGRYIDTELIASVTSGMFAAFITSQNPEARGSYNPTTGERDPIELTPGMVMELNPNEHVESVNPGRPNTAFEGFVTAVVRIIGTALEIPPEVLMKSFNASYSASRAALLEFWKMCKMYRAWLARNFCQPIYEEWLAEDIARGYTDAPGFFDDALIRQAWCAAVWNGPAPGHIQPQQEARAAHQRMADCITTGAQEAMEANGSDYEQNVIQRGHEERLRQQNGLPPLEPDAAENTPTPGASTALADDGRFLELEAVLDGDAEMLEHLESIKRDLAGPKG
jgi:lambda family phage portal protein